MSLATRMKLAARDGMVCWLCREPLVSLRGNLTTVDHVTPRSLGGTNGLANLRLAHKLCNALRGVVPAAEAQAFVQARLRFHLIRRNLRRARRGLPEIASPHFYETMTFEEKLAAQKQDEDKAGGPR